MSNLFGVREMRPKVAVFGAGALGRVYGVRLALRANVDVSFVVRPARADDTAPIAIESVRRDVLERLDAPVRTNVVPPDADVILLTVRTEDLESLRGPIGTSTAPIVILTPMLPRDWARVQDAFGDRAYAALPSVVAYAREDGVVRHWAPPTATKIDEPRSEGPNAVVVRELAGALTRAGLRTKLELGVHETNPATTVSFIVIGMAISIAGGVDALLEDEALAALTMQGCREGVRLGSRIGRTELWAPLAPVIATPWAMRLWRRALGRFSPEALFYAEEHFGRKLRAQHRVMIAEMCALAREKGLPHDALDELGKHLTYGSLSPKGAPFVRDSSTPRGAWHDIEDART